MRDVDGKEIKVGDKIAATMPYYKDSMSVGKVVGFTPKMVKIEIGDCEYNKFPNQIAIIS